MRNSLKPKLGKFGYGDFIVIASTIAIAISEDFNANDLNILSSFFSAIGDELGIIASFESAYPSSNNTNSTDSSSDNSSSEDTSSSSSQNATPIEKNNPNNNENINMKRYKVKKIKRKKYKRKKT